MAIYRMIFPLSVACFLAALASDIGYASSADLQYLHFSEWLIAAGLAVGAVAALVLLVVFVTNPLVRTGSGWLHLVAFYLALVVELLDSFVHTIDGWTAVVWNGMILSVIGAILAVVAAATLRRLPATRIAYREARA